MPLLDCINKISKYTTCTCCDCTAGLFSHMLFDIERKLFLLQLSGKNSVLASLYRRPGYRQITEIQCLNVFEAGARAADVPSSFGCNERLIYRLRSCFRESGNKNDKPPPGRPRITTPLEGRVIVTST